MRTLLTGTAFHARLLTLGESYSEDEAKTVVEKMLGQVHIVGEGYGYLGLTFYLYIYLIGPAIRAR